MREVWLLDEGRRRIRHRGDDPQKPGPARGLCSRRESLVELTRRSEQRRCTGSLRYSRRVTQACEGSRKTVRAKREGRAHGDGYLSNQQASSWGFSEAQAWDSGWGWASLQMKQKIQTLDGDWLPPFTLNQTHRIKTPYPPTASSFHTYQSNIPNEILRLRQASSFFCQEGGDNTYGARSNSSLFIRGRWVFHA